MGGGNGAGRPLILNAPMGGVAGGALAAAVTRPGGLGMIGIGSAGSTAVLQRNSGTSRILTARSALTDRLAVRAEPTLLEAALASRPALLSVSFGEDWSWVQRARDSGSVTATQIADLDGALRAVDAGVAVLVARGAEGGGHGQPRRGTLARFASSSNGWTCRCWLLRHSIRAHPRRGLGGRGIRGVDRHRLRRLS